MRRKGSEEDPIRSVDVQRVRALTISRKCPSWKCHGRTIDVSTNLGAGLWHAGESVCLPCMTRFVSMKLRPLPRIITRKPMQMRTRRARRPATCRTSQKRHTERKANVETARRRTAGPDCLLRPGESIWAHVFYNFTSAPAVLEPMGSFAEPCLPRDVETCPVGQDVHVFGLEHNLPHDHSLPGSPHSCLPDSTYPPSWPSSHPASSGATSRSAGSAGSRTAQVAG